MKKIKFASKRGFTLIELLVVIGILAVLAAIAIPSVAGLIDRANVSADKTNSNEMTNAIERFASEYELYCQDIASGKIKDTASLDSAQARVYNVTLATTRSDIEKLESKDGFNGRAIDRNTKYPTNRDTARSIVQTYTKTSSSTFEPKQSECHYYYSPDCGIVVTHDMTKATPLTLNALVPSGLNASGKALDEDTVWIDLTEDVVVEIPMPCYTLAEINKNPNLYAVGETKSEYVVVEFNDDKTEVVIFANGEDSDGIMKGTGYSWSFPTKSNSTLKKVTIKRGVTNIGKYVFCKSSNLETVIIPNTVTLIDDNAFTESGIQYITIPGSIKEVKGFNACSKLKTVTFQSGVEKICLHAFYGCDSLTTINFSDTITTIEGSAFEDCDGLTKVVLPSKLKSLGYRAFAYQENLQEVTIPGTITDFDTAVFSSNPSLKKATLGEGLTSIPEDTFWHSEKLKEVNIPSTVTSIGDGAFSWCRPLTNIKLHKNITYIGDYAFSLVYGTVYCETQELYDLMTSGNKCSKYYTTVILDPSQF